MPTVEQLRKKLIVKLNELFQLDQPDLDFGFYRIMHVKAAQITQFIENDLIGIIEGVFCNIDDSRLGELKKAYQQELHTAKEYGAAAPENSPKVLKAKAALDAAKDTTRNEADVYDYLYRFFERYYEDGDFISRRYYTRETQGRAVTYAIPYSGEEVKLHWTNADQYYVKSTDYFTNYTFDLSKSPEFEKQLLKPKKPLLVNFRIVEATEGSHGNIKDVTKRQFFLHNENPVELSETMELTVNFEYRPAGSKDELSDEQKAKLKKRFDANTEKDIPNLTITAKVLDKLQSRSKKEPPFADYFDLLSFVSDARKETAIKKLPVLGRYVNQYTARNTMDYFIHKNLGEFLHRELDFYIKNEVMRLDDIESADAPVVESYLAKIKVIRCIAGKLIDFLAQLENFQKRLWLKKKFVIETNYCITLDRVPEELYPEILANKEQLNEWKNLGFVVTKNKPETLKFLPLDTKFFSDDFKPRLLDSIEDFDEQCNGLLVHSENFQALNLLQERYREQVKCVYIDPPYNTDASEIVYKNGYKHSSWLSLMENRLLYSKQLLHDTGVTIIAIDDTEMVPLAQLIDNIFCLHDRNMVIVNHHPAGAGLEGTNISATHEYAIFITPKNKKILRGAKKEVNEELTERGFVRTGTADSNLRIGRPNSFYAILINPKTSSVVGIEKPPIGEDYPMTPTKEGHIRIYPVSPDGTERVWRRSYESCLNEIEQEHIICKNSKSIYHLVDDSEKYKPLFSNWTDKKYNAGAYGTNVLKSILGNTVFSYPKSIYTVMDCLNSVDCGSTKDCIYFLDYFAGSGTTGHAVINLNRDEKNAERQGNRKYILVEMGGHFDTVLKPRLLKVIYSPEWKDGKPTVHDQGISHCIKYLRLESYEDTLNNIAFDETPGQSQLMDNKDLREDYMLRYMLGVETKKSPSLLNIDSFADPMNYVLKVKKPSSDEYAVQKVDVIETFNYLIGIRVRHTAPLQQFTAKFKRVDDPETPKGANSRLVIADLRLVPQANNQKSPIYNLQSIEGWVPKDPNNPDNGMRENVLIVWRQLTDDIEKDNAVLDEWFLKHRINPRDFEYDTIYVNGSNTLPNLKREGEHWKVCLIEEWFMKLMFDTETI